LPVFIDHKKGDTLLQQCANVIKTRSFRQWIDIAGVAGLFVFAFGMLFKKSVAHAGILLMTLSYGFRLKDMGKEVLRDRLLLLSVAFFMFLLLRSILAALEFPEYKELLVEGAFKLFGAGFFLVYLIAFWLHRAMDKWDEILIVTLLGFLVQILRQIDWNNLAVKMHLILSGGERATFGFSTNRFGLFSALIFLSCLLLYRQIWGPPNKKTWYILRVAFWSLICPISALGVYFSQSRSAWIAAAIVIPTAAVWNYARNKKRNWKPLSLVVGLTMLAFLMARCPNLIERRSDLSGMDSRVRLYHLAWEKWKEHPLVGNGPGTSGILVQQGGDELALEKYTGADHFHNVVLDIAAQIGVAGLVFFGISFYLIAHAAFAAKNVNPLDREYILFALSGIVLILLTGIPNQPLSSPHGVYLIGFLGGICYSFKFASTNSIQTSPSHSSTPNDVLT
jgi:O-antigen ligase